MRIVRKVRHRSLHLLVVTALLVFVGFPGAALAGSSWFKADKEQYEAGDPVVLYGETTGGSLGWVEDGPFFGHLLETAPDWAPLINGVRYPLGELTVVEVSASKATASILFELPAGLEPGVYYFHYCNVDCEAGLGDLAGANLFVGVDPETTFPEATQPTTTEISSVPANASGVVVDPVVVSAAPLGELTDDSSRSATRFGVMAAIGVAAAIVAAAVLGSSRDGFENEY